MLWNFAYFSLNFEPNKQWPFLVLGDFPYPGVLISVFFQLNPENEPKIKALESKNEHPFSCMPKKVKPLCT